MEAIWWQDRDTQLALGSAVENDKEQRAWYFGFISSFMPEIGEERRERREREREGYRKIVGGTLNYNPLRDTAEFAFKIKRA